MEPIILDRDEIVLIAEAVEEFREDISGPHNEENRALAERLRTILGSPGDVFTLRSDRL